MELAHVLIILMGDITIILVSLWEPFIFNLQKNNLLAFIKIFNALLLVVSRLV